MPFEMMRIPELLMQKQAVAEIEKCNDFTIRFGLTLSRFDAVELVKTRSLALKNNGRIEFGGGVIEKIIRAFCHSPYISMHNYVDTLQRITEMFYFYKNETLDLISDDDLIEFMRVSFDSSCQGSLELLSERELANMARNLRYGYPPDYWKDSAWDKEVEDGEY